MKITVIIKPFGDDTIIQWRHNKVIAINPDNSQYEINTYKYWVAPTKHGESHTYIYISWGYLQPTISKIGVSERGVITT